MRLFFSTLLLLFALNAIAQTDESNSKFSIGVTFSPDASYRSLDSDNSPTSNLIMSSRNDSEISKISFTTGFSVLYKINNKIRIESGLQYSDKGEKTKEKVILISPPPFTTSKYYIIYHYVYLDIPIKANYYLIAKRTSVFLSLGASPSIFLKNRNTTIFEDEDGSEDKSKDTGPALDKINIAVIGGLGIDYDIADRMHIRFEPVYRHSLNPIKDTPIKQYLYSLGANFGFYYGL